MRKGSELYNSHCFAKTPCGLGDHGEGCPTAAFDTRPTPVDTSPVAWRWRSKGGVKWYYDPEPEWLAMIPDGEIDREPLYSTAALDASAKRIEALLESTIATLKEAMKGVIAIADRNTAESVFARLVLAALENHQ